MRRGVSLAARLAAATLVCVSLGAPAARAADETYDLHAILALSGAGAFLGQEEQQALKLIETVTNMSGGIHGRRLRMVFYDDQSNPQIAVQLTREVIAAQPSVIIGSSLVATCNAMAPLVQEGPVMYCLSAGIHPPDGSYVFTAGISTTDQADTLLRYFRLRGWTRIAIMTSTDATGQDADRGFDALLARPENADIKAIERTHFNPTDVSVAAQIERIKAAGVQAFVVWSTGTPVATVLRGLIQGGVEVPVGTTAGNMTYAQMTRFAGFLPQQLFIPSPAWPVHDDSRIALPPGVAAKQREFYAAFAAAGLKPDEGSILAWDPASLIVDALRALPKDASARQLHDYLVALKGAAGVNGIYDFTTTPQRGLSRDDTLVTRWNPAADRWEIVARAAGIPLEP